MASEAGNYRAYLTTGHWLTIRRLALERAGNHCQTCGGTENLDVHHNRYALYEERLTDVVVLCRKCHKLYHDNARLCLDA